MKLAIFIPALNEAATIGDVLNAVPKHFSGIREYKIFVIDDGSTDDTAHIALQHGAEVLRIVPTRGLANAFKMGLRASLDWGADLITHLDADGQYKPQEIDLLLAPILCGEADIVTGDRQVEKLGFLGWQRRYGNMLGSRFLRVLTGIHVKDASCGFRAYRREAAEQLEVHSKHTYTHETLIEAHYKSIRVTEVPISFLPRGQKGSSRLTGRLFMHVCRSLQGIFAAKQEYGRFDKKCR